MGQEISLKNINLQTTGNYTSERINLEPVYVIKETNELIYNSRMMESTYSTPLPFLGVGSNSSLLICT